jgi:Protein kinase domain
MLTCCLVGPFGPLVHKGTFWEAGFLSASTGIDRTHLVLFGMQNRTSCPELPAINRTLFSVESVGGRGWRIAKDIAAGLHYLHSLGIVHMDLKSSNVLLSRFGAAKIADVGLAKYQQQSYVRPDARQAHGGAPSNNYRKLAVLMMQGRRTWVRQATIIGCGLS